MESTNNRQLSVQMVETDPRIPGGVKVRNTEPGSKVQPSSQRVV